MKNIIIAIIISLAIGVSIGLYIKPAPAPAPAPAVTGKTDTLIQHDTTFITKVVKGKTLIISRFDTIQILSVDTTQIAEYEKIISELASRPDTEPIIQTKTETVKQPYMRFGVDCQATVEKSPDIIPGASLLLWNKLTPNYHYNIKQNKHIAGIGWVF